MSERDAVVLAKECAARCSMVSEDQCEVEIHILARALLKERERIESWKREEVLRDEREAGKDAEIAALKARLDEAEKLLDQAQTFLDESRSPSWLAKYEAWRRP